MFKMWMFKQSSKFRASGRNMGRWFSSEHTSCPNCGMEDEDSAHLMHCQDSGRFGLFRKEVNKLLTWLQSSHTDPDSAQVLRVYLMNRGAVQMLSIDGLPWEFLRFASSQDIIGWDNFLLGMVSMYLCGQFSTLISLSHLLSSMWTIGCLNSLGNYFILPMASGYTATYPSITTRWGRYKRLSNGTSYWRLIVLYTHHRGTCQRRVNSYWR
jgi:hypothetical protein